ncbi:MAG TPA: Glu/Leu/Phe/Val dehydrogenase [Candidatus Saccharimonadales bacterium]|nr:Glu/Leu/Phe/Val dehydrogenase [Candidatus Saccharimonadales bacterium]
MLKTAERNIRQAASSLGISDNELALILKPNKIHKVKIVVGDREYDGYRIQHSNKLGPYKGGIRFHHEVHLEEVQALATLMSFKTSAVGLPLGGGKGGVIVDVSEHDLESLEKIARGYVRELHKHIGPDIDIPAPDVNTNSQIIDWMTDEYEILTGEKSKASFTGKSLSNRGCWGREEATGRGGVIALREYLKRIGKDPKTTTIAVQGLGNVGYYFSKIAHDEYGMKIVAVSNSKKTILCDKGFDFSQQTYSRQAIDSLEKQKTSKKLAPEKILEQKVDVLVCAALADAIVFKNADSINAKIILELANGPVDYRSHEKMTKDGKVIIPDIIANAGGVIVSYYEWLQNKKDETWELDKVRNELDEILSKAMKETMDYSEKTGLSLKQSAFEIAIQNLRKDPEAAEAIVEEIQEELAEEAVS